MGTEGNVQFNNPDSLPIDKAVEHLSRKDVTAALAFDDVFVPPLSHDQYWHPKEQQEFQVRLPSKMLKIMEETGATAAIDLGSRLAQAGLDISDPTISGDIYSGTLINHGQNLLKLRSGNPLKLGFPYLVSRTEINNGALDGIIRLFNQANGVPRKEGLRYYPEVFSKVPDPEHPDKRIMTIDTPIVHIYPPVGRDLDLTLLPRGTQRKELHEALGLTRIDYRTLGREYAMEQSGWWDAAEIENYLRDKLAPYLNSDSTYSLTETAEPIHYPEGWGIIIKGGVIIDWPITWVTHGASVVGEHRGTMNPKVNPPHALLSEFHFPTGILLDKLIGNYHVDMLCQPVRLAWA